MTILVKINQSRDVQTWADYVRSHPLGTLYHLPGWKSVIEKTYGHKTYYLMAIKPVNQNNPKNPLNSTNFHPVNFRKNSEADLTGADNPTTSSNHALSANSYACPAECGSDSTGELNTEGILGILPLVHFKNMIFGNSLISIPFFDLGGILVDDEETETALLNEAVKLAQRLGAKNIELRNQQPIGCLKSKDTFQQSFNNEQNLDANPDSPIIRDDNVGLDMSFHIGRIGFSQFHPEIEEKEKSSKSSLPGEMRSLFHRGLTKNNRNESISFTIKSNKVQMLLELPDSSEELMKSFKSKLRSQIKKPIKEGLKSEIGGQELLDDFYKVFSVNMRDLGSPVHSKKLIRNVLTEFANDAKLVLIYKEQEPVAASVIVGFKDTLGNPWASSLREYSKFAPNMLLYWAMLDYGCDNGFKYFDFGRSTPDGGTYKFKKQWGAKPESLNWHYISLDGQPVGAPISERSSFEFTAKVWKKLPVPVANVIGPRIRKYIGL